MSLPASPARGPAPASPQVPADASTRRRGVIQDLLLARSRSATTLSLADRNLTVLPLELRALATLRRVDLSRNRFPEWPSELQQLASLVSVDLSRNRLTRVVPAVGPYPATLVTLNVARNEITHVDSEVAQLASLNHLVLAHNPITTFPGNLDLDSLVVLDLAGCKLRWLPTGRFPALQTLNVSHNGIEELSDTFLHNAPALHTLLVDGNLLTSLPAALFGHPHIERVSATSNAIVVLDIPRPLPVPDPPLLELDLSDNKLGVLSHRIAYFRHLESLSVAGNELQYLPDEICELTALRLLDISDNEPFDGRLPAEMGRLVQLAEFYYEGSGRRRAAPLPAAPSDDVHGDDETDASGPACAAAEAPAPLEAPRVDRIQTPLHGPAVADVSPLVFMTASAAQRDSAVFRPLEEMSSAYDEVLSLAMNRLCLAPGTLMRLRGSPEYAEIKALLSGERSDARPAKDHLLDYIDRQRPWLVAGSASFLAVVFHTHIFVRHLAEARADPNGPKDMDYRVRQVSRRMQATCAAIAEFRETQHYDRASVDPVLRWWLPLAFEAVAMLLWRHCIAAAGDMGDTEPVQESLLELFDDCTASTMYLLSGAYLFTLNADLCARGKLGKHSVPSDTACGRFADDYRERLDRWDEQMRAFMQHCRELPMDSVADNDEGNGDSANDDDDDDDGEASEWPSPLMGALRGPHPAAQLLPMVLAGVQVASTIKELLGIAPVEVTGSGRVRYYRRHHATCGYARPIEALALRQGLARMIVLFHDLEWPTIRETASPWLAVEDRHLAVRLVLSVATHFFAMQQAACDIDAMGGTLEMHRTWSAFASMLLERLVALMQAARHGCHRHSTVVVRLRRGVDLLLREMLRVCS